MLIPIYVLIGVWGGERRAYATLKFVIYTMAGSLLMLASIIAFGLSQGTFDLVESGVVDERLDLPRLPRRVRGQGAALPVPRLARRRLPRVAARGRGDPLGRRLEGGGVRPPPDRDREVPGAGRETSRSRSSPPPSIGLVYGSLLAFRARDVRSVTAYSSMAQMGLIVLGLFSLNELGVNGAILQSVAHGLVSATLFLLAGMVETRTGTSAFAAARRDGARPARRSRRSCWSWASSRSPCPARSRSRASS